MSLSSDKINVSKNNTGKKFTDGLVELYFSEFTEVFACVYESFLNQYNKSEPAYRETIRYLNNLIFLCFRDKKVKELIRDSAKKLDAWQCLTDIKEKLALSEASAFSFLSDNTTERNYKVFLTNETVDLLCNFLDKYTFGFEKEKKENIITPAIIGISFENLTSITNIKDIRSSKGIFYTAESEIELMCRLSLVDNVANKIGQEYKSDLYSLLETNNEQYKDIPLSEVYKHLLEIKVIDPACGSGGILASMLKIIDSLQAKCQSKPGIKESAFERRKRIITENLYGIDALEWACDAATLRLSLELLETLEEFEETDSGSKVEISYNIIAEDSFIVDYSKSFTGIEDGKFDIVIGNPPYVRQEFICKPLGTKKAGDIRIKKEYKDNLSRKIVDLFPGYFKAINKKEHVKVNAKSDLYIYFYFLGLSLLNDNGTLCFITSNSWLDVDFGSELQGLLLKHSHIKMLIDNLARRSFDQADVNTVISIISAVNEDSEAGLEKTCKLITFKTAFNSITFSEVFRAIKEQKGRSETLEYKLIAMNQGYLYEQGCSYAENISNKTVPGKFTGVKIGGKYLRAPDIYEILLEKARDKIIPLGHIVRTRFGIKSGANDFFYIDKDISNKWNIEKEYLKPFLFSLKEVKNFEVASKDLKRQILVCNESIENLKKLGKNNIIQYIKWGESQKYNLRPSVKHRKLWYSLPEQGEIHFVSNRFLGERFGFPWIENILACDVFFTGKFNNDKPLLNTALLNSTLSFLSAEVLARKTYGIGVAYIYGTELNSIDITDYRQFSAEEEQEINQIFKKMRGRKLLKIEDELLQSDRQQLDEIVFNKVGLTEVERDGVRESLVNMVKVRLKKAESLKK